MRGVTVNWLNFIAIETAFQHLNFPKMRIEKFTLFLPWNAISWLSRVPGTVKHHPIQFVDWQTLQRKAKQNNFSRTAKPDLTTPFASS